MLKRTFIFTALVAASALAFGTAVANPSDAPSPDGDGIEACQHGKRGKRGWHGKRRGPGPRFFAKNAEALGLDDTTVAAIKDIFQGAKDQRKALRQQTKLAKTTLRDLMGAEVVDSAAILAQAKTLGALKAQKVEARATTMLQVRSLLTAEQFAKVKALKKERRGKFNKRGKRGKRGFRNADPFGMQGDEGAAPQTF